MEALFQKLSSLSTTIQKFEKFIQQLKLENQELREKLEELEVNIEEKEQAFNALHERYEANKAVKALVADENKEELVEKIDNYLKEIDICLNLFGDQSLVGNTIN